MAHGKLAKIEIHPDGHGGHKVVHHYTERPASRNRNAPSGFSIEQGGHEEKYFGQPEEHKMLAHVAKELDIELPSNFSKHMAKAGKEGSTEMDTEGSRHEVGEEMD
jgi:hypothetical protein